MENKSKNPVKKGMMSKIPDMPEEEIENETFEEEETEDDDIDDEEDEDVALPTNNPEKFSKAPNQQRSELELELKLRRLADIERQLKTKKISIKNDAQLTGVMSEQEMLGLAAALKYEVNSMIMYMKRALKLPEKWFIDLFNDIVKGEKNYEYWLFDEKSKL